MADAGYRSIEIFLSNDTAADLSVQSATLVSSSAKPSLRRFMGSVPVIREKCLLVKEKWAILLTSHESV